ncbi:hypothetical protein [Pseudomonas capsici]|uniref:hypothetical protein n=1 Tax=Pseudomonas capsici TaxID=2810614 RepID=UPI0021F1730B|nr:hypothetical protein [Pseudomonas capsici]MCV4343232.1 hypothetical protein [Pseudomonas capsici]
MIVMRPVFFALVASLIAGCSTSPISPERADPVPGSRIHAFIGKGDAQIVVTRDSGFYGAACNYFFYIDGVLAAEFASGEVAKFGVKRGRHILGIKPSLACSGNGLIEREVQLEAGESVRRRITISGDSYDITPTAM